MGKRKKDQNVLAQFCYYCDKEYDHKDTLLEHQRDRHFACLKCHKKFSTAGSMSTHMLSVHRETLARVPNAKTGRDSLDVSIYGMEGVPAIVIEEKMMSKLKKRRQILQEKLQKTINSNEKLKPTNILELKSNNEYFKIFKRYTEKMEIAAGVKTPQIPSSQNPNIDVTSLPPPPPPKEEAKSEPQRKRDIKYAQIMKEEAKQHFPTEAENEAPAEVKPKLNLNISKQAKKDYMVFSKKLSPEEIRAKMDKYRYDEKKIMSQLKNLLKR